MATQHDATSGNPKKAEASTIEGPSVTNPGGKFGPVSLQPDQAARITRNWRLGAEPASAENDVRKPTTVVGVRLSARDLDRLDGLARVYDDGDRSATLRRALDMFEERVIREIATDEYLAAAWTELGGFDEQAVADAGKYFE